jgi:hypothetical protein
MYRELDDLNFSDNYLKTIYKRIISGKFGLADPDPGNDIKFRLFPKTVLVGHIAWGVIKNGTDPEVKSRGSFTVFSLYLKSLILSAAKEIADSAQSPSACANRLVTSHVQGPVL